MLDAGLAAGRETVGVRASDSDRSGPECQRLDDVGARADAGVEDHRDVARCRDHVREQVDGGDAAVGLTAAVVGAVDAVDAVVDRRARVLGRVHALDQERQVGDRSDPVEVVPRHAGVAERERPEARGGLDVLLGGAFQARAEHRIAEVVGEAEALELREAGEGQVAWSPSQGQGVEGDDDRRVAGRLGAADEALAEFPVARRIELEPTGGVAELGGDVLHRYLHQRGGHHRHAGRRGCPGGGQITLATGLAESDDPDGRQHQRRRVVVTEQIDPHLALRRPAQDPWHEPPPLERRDVGALGVFVPGPAAHIGPDLGGECRLGRRRERVETHRQLGNDPLEASEVDPQLPVTVVRHAMSPVLIELVDRPFCSVNESAWVNQRGGWAGRA